MKFGIHHNGYAFDGQGYQITEHLRKLAGTAEEIGLDSFWLSDHLHQNPGVGRPEDPMLDSWTTLPTIAAATKKIRLGTMVTANTSRPPSLLAKIAATVDVLSNGRVFMGIGAGNQAQEAEAYGIPFPGVPERLGRLREAVQIIQKLWTQDYTTFDGKYYHVKGAICNPKPIQKPRPQILIGGGGEKVTLRIVARYADACNVFAGTPEAYKAKLDVLKEHCKAVGRDYGSIVKTKGGRVVVGMDGAAIRRRVEERVKDPQWRQTMIYGSYDDVIKRIGEFKDVGLEYLIAGFDPASEVDDLKAFSQVVKSL
jgi:F420-dependent oxidoreductase-like protein